MSADQTPDQTRTEPSLDTNRRRLVQGTAAAVSLASIGPWFIRELGAQEQIAIANLHPTTGPFAADGNWGLAGVRLAVQEVNARGGIKSLGGARIRLVSGDTQGRPEVGGQEAERVIREGAVGIVGSYVSSITNVTTQVAERNRIPHVIDEGVADDILNRGFKFSFRIATAASMMSGFGASHWKMLREATGVDIKTIAYMHENSFYGSTMAKVLPDLAKQNGIEIKELISYSARATDLTVEIAKAIAANADLIVTSSYFGDALLIAKTLRTLKPKVKGIVGLGNGAFSSHQFIEQMKDGAEGILDTNLRWNPRHPRMPAILAEFAKIAPNTPMTHQAIMAYTAAQVLMDGIDRAKSKDPAKIRDAIAAGGFKDHVLPQGAIEFDEKGQNKGATLLMMQVQKGKIVTVLPSEFAEAKPIFPAA